MKDDKRRPRRVVEEPGAIPMVEPVIFKNNGEDFVTNMADPVDDSILSDVEGSYTGTPVDGDEPVQDADDL